MMRSNVCCGTEKKISEQAPAQKEGRRYAVCVVGAMRSLYMEQVWSSIERFFLKEMKGSKSRNQIDLYYHIYTGVELSLRGQRNISTEVVAPGLVRALRSALAVQFQTEENQFTCEQMTTGRFFKIESCAKMIHHYITVSNPNTMYDVLVITRPDLEYFLPYTIHSFDLGLMDEERKKNHSIWFHQVFDELWLGTFFPMLRLAATMTKAKCCNHLKRPPTGCFLSGVKGPRANYIGPHHFIDQIPDVTIYKQPKPYVIIRTDDELKEIHNLSKRALHGKIKPDVRTFLQPKLSSFFLWSTKYSSDKQLQIVSKFLPTQPTPSSSSSSSSVTPHVQDSYSKNST